MRVGLTGGTGVVGGAVLRHLQSAGHEVRAVARSGGAADRLVGEGAEALPGDVTDHTALVRAFDGCEVVYHVAGVNEMCSRDPAAMYRVNVDGTRTVLRACAAAGVRRMVLTSSAVTIGEERGVVATEDTPHRGRYLSRYERSKHHAEQVAFSEDSPVEVVSVNPSSFQGPGRATGTGRIILGVLQGRIRFLVESDVTIVDIDDCARGHLLAAERGRPGERYLLSGFTMRVSEAVDLAAGMLGRPVSTRMLPLPVAWAGSALVAAPFYLARRPPPLCPEMVRVIAHGHRHDGSRATRELGLEYTSATETLSRMVEWFRREGMLTA
ncbi:MAG: NAD-dependent epimerase/dehydratase family protein [Actinomycetota bacterium]